VSIILPCWRVPGVRIAQSVQWLGRGLSDRGSITSRTGLFSFHRAQTECSSYPVYYSVGTRVIWSKARRPWREADHSPTSTIDVKMRGSLPPLPHT
jgi:hypothetical protein